MNGKPTILFDGYCNLCAGLVRFLLRSIPNEGFSFVPAQSSSGHTLTVTYNIHGRDLETIILIDGDRIYQQSDAALHILRRVPFPWKLGALLRIIPRSIRDWLYNIIAANRYCWFGKRELCFLEIPVNEKRFLGAQESRAQLEE